MIETKKMKNRGVPVVNVYFVGDGLGSMLVGGAIALPALDAATRHPDGVTFIVMIASVGGLAVRGSTKFSGPDYESVFQHVTLLQVLEKTGDRFVDSGTAAGESVPQVPVVIPASAVELDETNA